MQEKAPLPNRLIEESLLKARKVFLWGAVEDESAQKIVEQLHYLSTEDKAAPIHFHINSPGGAVTSGFAIYDMMHTIDAPVYTYCLGFTASMGSILLSAGVKGHRYIYPTAEVMIHQPGAGDFQATYADIEIHAQHIMKTKELSADILAKNCGKTVKEIIKDFDRDYWMDAKAAVAYGIVDKIVN